jgi:two-component sensor histidine kinase
VAGRGRAASGWALPAAALLLPLALLLGGGLLAWRNTLAEAEAALRQSADTGAEFGTRVLAGYVVSAGRVNDLTRGLSDAEITAREEALHRQLAELIPDVPEAEAAYVIDRTGTALLAANLYPVPRDRPTAADRDFFLALRADSPPRFHVSQVYVSRFDGVPFFAVSRRRSGTANGLAPDEFDGAVNLSVYPHRLQPAMRRLLRRDGDGLALVREDGKPLASTAAASPEALAALAAAAAPGGQALRHEAGLVLAAQKLEGFPVVAVASRPIASVAAEWRATMANHMLFGVPATLALLLLSLRERQQQRRLEAANQALGDANAALAEALRASEGNLKRAQDAAGVLSFDMAADGTVADAGGLRALFGLPPGAALDQAALVASLHPDDQEAARAEWRRLARDGGRLAAEYRVRLPDGGQRWVMLRGEASPGYGPAPPAGLALPGRVSGVAMDVTQRRESEERTALLAFEVTHRAKNTLAVVQAALRLTKAPDYESYVRAVEGRVAALARAQSMLAESQWREGDLRALLEAELRAFQPATPGGGPVAEGEPAVRLSGPPVSLPVRAVQALAMAVHELATNAVKYGALSSPGGRLHISWCPDAAWLYLAWREAGGPAVTAEPARKGFGSRVIEQTIRFQLGGRLEKRWAPTGLECDIAIPLAAEPPAAQEPGLAPRPGGAS